MSINAEEIYVKTDKPARKANHSHGCFYCDNTFRHTDDNCEDGYGSICEECQAKKQANIIVHNLSFSDLYGEEVMEILQNEFMR